MLSINLPAQFIPFDGWKSDYFTSPDTGHHIRYCFSVPKHAKKTIIILPGLSEFCEKYIETTQFLNQYGFSVYIIDWAYQGKSIRHSNNTHKRHSDGFDTDIKDLHYLIRQIISPKTRPYILGHSMGGHLGLRYLSEHTDTIKAAALSSPMFGIYDLRYKYSIVQFITWLNHFFFNSYIPGGHDWKKSSRSSDGSDIFSSDPLRDALHNQWCLYDTTLQVGSPTMKWLYDAILSIKYMNQSDLLNNIQTPLYIGLAEQEKIVDNKAILKAVNQLPHVTYDVFTNAQHEILMERDSIRDLFLQNTLTLFSS